VVVENLPRERISDKGRSRSRFTNTIKEFFHLPHRLFDADHNGARDNAVTDVELDDFRNFRNR
jgi:hypothetical protein